MLGDFEGLILRFPPPNRSNGLRAASCLCSGLSLAACAECTQDAAGPTTIQGSSACLCKVSSDTHEFLHLILKLDFSLFKFHSELAQFHLLIQKRERGFEKAYNKGS